MFKVAPLRWSALVLVGNSTLFESEEHVLEAVL